MRTVLMLLSGVLIFATVATAGESHQSLQSEPLFLAQARFKEFEPLPGEQVIRGEILKIEKDTYLIKDQDGKEHRIKINDNTILRADFKPGERIQAHVKDGVASVVKYMALGPQTPQQSQPGILPHQSVSKGSELLPGHRVVTGIVEEVKGGMARVRFGDLETRPLALKQDTERGMAPLKPGDRVEIIINSENGVVDYHRQGEPSQHRVLRGRVAEVAEGVETALIVKNDGAKERYQVQPEARSRIKRVFDGAPALFLIGEANNILDAMPENFPEVQLPIKKSDTISPESKERVPK
jgi:hypothetical protein